MICWGIGAGVMGAGLMFLALFRLSEPCPRCGSRLKGNMPRGPDGKLQEDLCNHCGNRWLSAWARRARENE